MPTDTPSSPAKADVPRARAKPPSRKGKTKMSREQIEELPALFEQKKGVAQIARMYGVSRDTIYEYMRSDPVLEERCKTARAAVDDQVEQSLAEVATRSRRFLPQCEECERAARRDKDRQIGHAVCSVCHEDIVVTQADADPRAIAFYLTNRRPDEWRNRRDVTVENVLPKDAVLVVLTQIFEHIDRCVSNADEKRKLAEAVELAAASIPDPASTVH